MRAKVTVESVTKHAGGNETVVFRPVAKSGPYPEDGHDEDNNFARWSPSGRFELTIANPALHNKFKPGEQKFYVDFTEA